MDVLKDLISQNKDRLKPIGFFAITILGLYGLSTLLKVEEQQDEQNPKKGGGRPAGIMNQGNTCFVNSLLQALASAQTFKQNIQDLLKIHVPSDDNQQLIAQLNSVIKKINKNSQNISVMNLLQIIARTQDDLINFQQQDTYELYSSIVRAFDQFYNKRKQFNLSKSMWEVEEDQIQNCLIGYTKSTIECTICRNTMTIKNHSFYDLSLQIQSNFITSLKSALIWFQRKQKIQSYACTFCSVNHHIKKLQLIRQMIGNSKWSKQLSQVNEKIINFLKKSSFQDMDLKQINGVLEIQVTEFTQIFNKIGNDRFRNQIFSLIKPVERQILKQTKITKYPKFLVIHFKQLVINPYTGEPAYIRKPMDFSSVLQIQGKNHRKIYKLTSLLTHIGNQQMGHYFTFRKPTKDSQQWFLISDTHTQRVSQQKMKRTVPYMLFYELDEQICKDPIQKDMKQKQQNIKRISKSKIRQSQKFADKIQNRLYQDILIDDEDNKVKQSQVSKQQNDKQMKQEICNQENQV